MHECVEVDLSRMIPCILLSDKRTEIGFPDKHKYHCDLDGFPHEPQQNS
jgi:hypothetical protein